MVPSTIYGKTKGKIAIVGRGECFFWEKVKIAHEAGAIGIIIINKFQNYLALQMNRTEYLSELVCSDNMAQHCTVGH